MRTVLIMIRMFLLAVLTLAVVGPACAGGEPVDGPTVVVTTSIWADVVGALDPAGEWTIDVLIPRGADPHDFAPSAAQVASLQRADLVIANGLGLEGGLEDALVSAEADGVHILWLAPALDPIPLTGGTALDPHVWLDPIRLAMAASLIAAELDATTGGTRSTDAVGGFAGSMTRLADEMATLLEGVDDRRLVTNHDALGYFADRFGFEVIGTVIPGGSTVAEPSSRDVALLISGIRDSATPAIFVDAEVPHLVADAVAAEFDGAVAIVELRTGSLAGSGEASTIIGLLRQNAERIADALGGS